MFSEMHFKLKCLGLLVCVLDNNVKKKPSAKSLTNQFL